jgi:transposase-like protein
MQEGERRMAISFQGAHFPKEVMLMGVRWYVAYPLSTRHVEELMEERGVEVDHSTINRWVMNKAPCGRTFRISALSSGTGSLCA